MKKAVIRILAVTLALILASGSFCVLAEGGDWTCENCGQTGNTGKFCPNCGAAKPDGSWDCDNCGETGNTGKFCPNCGAAKPAGGAGSANVQTVNEWLEQIPGETDRVKVCLLGVEASGYINNKDKWIPEHAVDGDESTCWQVRFKDSQKGKVWLQLNTGNEQTVEEIWFKNGFWAYNTDGKDQYYMNARARKIRVSFRYNGETAFRDEIELNLKDEVFTDWQRYSLGRHEHVAAVRMTVYSKYAGNEESCVNDLCLSEVMLVKNAPAAGAKPAPASKTATVYESNPAISGAKLLMKIATRSGPGTEYESTGTFFGNNWQEQTVKVTGRDWDGSMWWVQLDFWNGKKARYRVWTVLKRVDVNIDKVKEVNKAGTLHVEPTKAYCGPGTGYAKLKDVLFAEDNVDFYGWENGFVEIDYYDVNRSVQRRCWVPENKVSNVKRK